MAGDSLEVIGSGTPWKGVRSYGLVALGLLLVGCGDESGGTPLLGVGIATAGGPGFTTPLPDPSAQNQWVECARMGPGYDPITNVALAGADGVVFTNASGKVLLAHDDSRPVELTYVSKGSTIALSPDGASFIDPSKVPWERRTIVGDELINQLWPGVACGPSLRFTPDGKYLLASGSPAACVIDVATGEAIVRSEQVLLPFGYDAGALVVRTGQTTLGTLDAAGALTSEVALAGELEPQDLELSPAGDRAVGRTYGGGLAVYDTQTGEVLASYELERPSDVRPLFSNDGSFVAVGDRVLATADGSELLAIASGRRGYRAVALSDDGTRLALLATDDHESSAMILDIASDEVSSSAGGHARPVIGIAVSPDGQHMATTTGYTMLSWQIETTFVNSQLEWGADTGLEVYPEYSPDGSLLAISGDGRELFTLDGASAFGPPFTSAPDCSFAYFAFSPDGRWVAGGGYIDQVQVFDVETHELVAELPTASCNSSVTFSADGQYLLTSAPELYRTSDWSREWPETVVPVALGTEYSGLDSAVFTPDGRNVLVSHCEGTGPSPSCDNVLWSIGGVRGASLGIDGPRPHYSKDGTWLLAGAFMMHPQTGIVHALPQAASSAWAPNGDVIFGETDGSISRYCLRR